MLSWCIHGPDQVAGIRFLVPLMTSPFWTLLTRSHRWSEFDTVRWACRLTPVFVLLHEQLDHAYATTERAFAAVTIGQILRSESKIMPLCDIRCE